MEAELLELNARAKEDGKLYAKKRFIFAEIERLLKGRAFIAIAGPRGAGKTVALRQLLEKTESSFYLSLDARIPEKGIFETAKELEEKGINLLLLDEVHAYPDFGRELKKIYDFLKIKVVFTSSSAIGLSELSADLSRRAILLRLPPFSLREYAYFEKNEEFPQLELEGIIDEQKAREYYGKTIRAEALFERYLKGGNCPFALGNVEVLPLLRNTLDKIIGSDLTLAGKLSPQEALEAKKMVSFIGKARVDGISYSSLSKNLGITIYKAEKYVRLLEWAFVLKRVMPKGTNVLREPKVLMALPYRLLYADYGECIGALREDFFAEMMGGHGYPINYLKSTRGAKTPDYIVGKTVFEIGGASKGASQFRGIGEKYEKIILTQPGAIGKMKRPLYFAGMLGGK
ncbi:ATP-binding protein [Candidatus Micrarchaeota archaeon]|nr:ATP-binding protein [Candidatus Micrarchaeota archaeon]